MQKARMLMIPSWILAINPWFHMMCEHVAVLFLLMLRSLFGSKLREAQRYREAKWTGFTGMERFNW